MSLKELGLEHRESINVGGHLLAREKMLEAVARLIANFEHDIRRYSDRGDEVTAETYAAALAVLRLTAQTLTEEHRRLMEALPRMSGANSNIAPSRPSAA